MAPIRFAHRLPSPLSRPGLLTTVVLPVAVFLGGCGAEGAKAITDGVVDTSVEVDEDAPIIEHVPIDTAQPISQDVEILAIVTDELSPIDTVAVHYKRPEDAEWKSNVLSESDSETGTWTGVIPGADITGGNIVYYLQAFDSEGNEGFSPLDGEANPHGFRVNPDA